MTRGTGPHQEGRLPRLSQTPHPQTTQETPFVMNNPREAALQCKQVASREAVWAQVLPFPCGL